jgi:hypothetical protein
MALWNQQYAWPSRFNMSNVGVELEGRASGGVHRAGPLQWLLPIVAEKLGPARPTGPGRTGHG